jgi:hypothetical protein
MQHTSGDSSQASPLLAPKEMQGRLWRWLVVAVWLVCASTYITMPGQSDQYQHSYMGWRLLQGAVPYHDFIDPGWPGIMWTHAVSTGLFGNHLWSWHILDFAFLALSAAFLQSLLARAAGGTAARISLILYPIYYAGLPYIFSGQHDMTAGHFLVMALWFHVRGYETLNWRWQLGTGAFIGLAMLNKPTVGIVGIIFVIHAMLFRLSRPYLVRHTLVAGGASVAILLAAVLVLLAQGSKLHEIADVALRYNLSAQGYDPPPAWILPFHLFELHVKWLLILTLGGGISSWWIFRSASRSIRTTALPALWASGVCSYFLQGKGYYYHLGPCFPSLIGLTACALSHLGTMQPKRIGPAGWRRLSLFFLLLVTAMGVKKMYRNYSALPGAVLSGNFEGYLSRFDGGDGLNVAETLALVRRIELQVPAHESVLVFGDTSAINFLARRPQPTHFPWPPLLLKVRPHLPQADRWNTLWEDDLRSSNVRLCLVSRISFYADWLQGESRTARSLMLFLKDRYKRTDTFGSPDGFDIYERR